VEVRDARVESIAGSRGAFRIELAAGTIEARRILIATGLIDEMVPIEGFRELWGNSIFQCPYCHGWEVQDRRWGYLALPIRASHVLPFGLQMRGWTRDVTVFTNGAVEVPDDARTALQTAGIRLETSAITRLIAAGNRLEAVELADRTTVACDVLFAHPPQRHVDLVRGLGLAVDDEGFVIVDPMKRETSVAGIYASGDLTTRMQGALFAAASGTQAAAAINVELSMELALSGAL
jgi:thioredoxin reductase